MSVVIELRTRLSVTAQIHFDTWHALIPMPPTGQALYDYADTMSALAEPLSRLGVPASTDCFVEICDLLHTHTIDEMTGDIWQPISQGILSIYPAFSMIASQPPQNFVPLQTQYNYLKAVGIAAISRLHASQDIDQTIFQSAISTYCREVRRLCFYVSENDAVTVLHDINSDWSFAEFSAFVTAKHQVNPKPKTVGFVWNALGPLLSYAVEYKIPPAISQRTSSSPSSQPSSSEKPKVQNSIVANPILPSVHNVARKSGVASVELQSGKRYFYPKPTSKLQQREHLAHAAYRIRGMQRVIERNNINLPVGKRLLSQSDLAQTELLYQLLHGDGDVTVRLFIIFAMLLSANRDRLSNVQLVPTIRCANMNSLTYCFADGALVIPELPVAERATPRITDAQLFRKAETCVIVYLPPTIQQTINRLLLDQSIYINGSEKLFTEENLDRDVDAYLRSHRQNIYYLKISRLQKLMCNLLSQHHMSETVADFTLGKSTAKETSNAAYYLSVTRSALAESYYEIVEKLFSLPHEQHPLLNRNVLCGYVGSRICPLDSTVQGIATDLIQALEHYRYHSDIDSFREFHNHYTAYTTRFLGFATGYRAVNEPVITESEINFLDGFLVINDKSRDDNFDSRLVPIPPVCLQQLQLYRLHRTEVLRRLSLFFPTAIVPTSWLFFLGKKYQPGPVTNQILLQQSKWSHAFQLNINRHWLISKMFAAGIPEQYIATWAGHWRLGQQPYSRFSTVTPLDVKRVIVPIIEKQLTIHGWTTIPGVIA